MARIPPDMGVAQLNEILPRLADQGLPGGGEFLVADVNESSPAIIALLVWHGFLPMGGMGLLLPKLHERRCLLEPANVHVGRKTRRRAKGGFHLTVGMSWERVVKGIQDYTFTEEAGDCWLSDELAAAWLAVNKLDAKRRCGVMFHSVELWHTATQELVAGEIGYTCGAIYSSCTGFTLKDRHAGAGSVQLACLGRWLQKSGFRLWDLGMELDYKIELGGRSVSRTEWVKRSRELRLVQAELVSPADAVADSASLMMPDSTVCDTADAGNGLAAKSRRKEGNKRVQVNGDSQDEPAAKDAGHATHAGDAEGRSDKDACG